MATYRYSHIAKFAHCPYQYYRDVVLGEEKRSEEMVLGTATHIAIQKVVADGDYVENAASTSAQAVMKDEGLPVNIEDVMWLAKRALKFLSTGRNTQACSDGGPSMGRVVNTERTVMARLDDTDEFSPVVKGTVDLVCGEAEDGFFSLWDWKTGRAVADIMQLKVYAYIFTRLGFSIKNVGLVYLRKNERVWFEITREMLSEAENWIRDNIGLMELAAEELLLGGNPVTLYPARSNCHCGTCRYISECPLSVSGTLAVAETPASERFSPEGQVSEIQAAPDRITSHEEAERLGAEIIRMEGLAELFKTRLKQFVKDSGRPVVVGNKCFDFIPSTSWSFSADNLKQLASEIVSAGFNPWSFLELPSASRNRLFEQMNLPEDKATDFLKKYGVDRTGTSFRCVALKQVV